MERRRAFIKKFPTVVGSKPSCRAIVTCISFDGRFVSCENNNVICHKSFSETETTDAVLVFAVGSVTAPQYDV